MKTKTNVSWTRVVHRFNLQTSAVLFMVVGLRALAVVHYVDVNGTNATKPYTNWATAAAVLQDAADAAAVGDTILVTNGIYQIGGRGTSSGATTNRVFVPTRVNLQSVNGAAVTVIQGSQAPGTTNGPGAVRCVYLSASATLTGFTLTNGGTLSAGDTSGGGVSASARTMVSDCIIVGNSAYAYGGGVYGNSTPYAMLSNCTLVSNSAQYGGGSYRTVLNGCTLANNSASQGGGANSGILSNCTLTANSGVDGGGVYSATVTNCSLLTNSATYGGATHSGSLTACLLAGNSASYSGGGAWEAQLATCVLKGNSAVYGGGAANGTLNNCALLGNTASWAGGGVAFGTTLNNCTLTGNSSQYGGGTLGGTINNCIIYYNSALIGPNYYSSTLNYCCTTPLPDTGGANIDSEPALASLFHLSAISPCQGAGSPAYTKGTDIDGDPWSNPPSIGCDEFSAASISGALSVSILAVYTNVAMGFGATFTGSVAGRVSASKWDFADGTVMSNRTDMTHAWIAPGDYPVVLTAYNTTYPGGVSATAIVHVVTQPVHYVSVSNPKPSAPFDSWSKAATNIQDAVDAATVPGALVLVTNGTYKTGGRAVYGSGSLSNRVALTMPLVLQSLNGPDVTRIEGMQVPDSINGEGAVRCAYLTGGAALVGFTLTNGATRVSGDSAQEQSGGGVCCPVGTALVSNCILAGNSAFGYGAGAFGARMNNSVLTGNVSSWWGGGAYGCVLNNCTLTGNSAFQFGGGAYGCTLNNCILHYNSGNGSNYYLCNLNFCSATPLPSTGTGNIDSDPQLASAFHLSAVSPCLRAGNVAYASGTDIDGESWTNPPSIGCDEFHPAAMVGPLYVSVLVDYTNVLPGYTVNFQAAISGRPSASRWELDDGTVVSNRPYASQGWASLGAHPIILRAYNESNPGGISATAIVHVVTQPVHYVAINNPAPASPYTSWSTAATNIQDAVDAASVPGALVLVSNGVYAVGGKAIKGALTNRVAIAMPLVLQSLNGPEVTIIQGYQVPGTTNGVGAVRGVFLATNGILSGFTVANGATMGYGTSLFEDNGGGLWCASGAVVVTNCSIQGNSASSQGGGAYQGAFQSCIFKGNASAFGGGISGGTLSNCFVATNSATSSGGGAQSSTLVQCALSGNFASSQGGGAQSSTLVNCVLTDNSAPQLGGLGGGACLSTLINCILTRNAAQSGGGVENSTLNNCTLVANSGTYGSGADSGTLNNCIVFNNGVNFTTALNNCWVYDPLFVDAASGNYHLQSNSPCINAGRNAYVTTLTDLEGNPRIAGGTVDIGAYEFPNPSSVISYAWLQLYGLTNNGTADYADSDSDGMNNWQEWIAGTDPTNPSSLLLMLAPSNSVSGIMVPWLSISGKTYFLQRSADLSVRPAFLTVYSNLVGEAGTTAYTDTNTVGPGPFYYRVGVQQ